MWPTRASRSWSVSNEGHQRPAGDTRFLDHRGLPSDNNHAEREIRPAVIIRKNSLCNRSENGASVQAILMSVYRTLKLRGLDPLETIVAALKDYVRTGSLPPLPGSRTSDR